MQLSLKYLTLPLLKLAAASFESTSNEKVHDVFFINTLRTTFSSSEALNNSFLYDAANISECPVGYPSGIHIHAVRESYKLILGLSSFEIVMDTFVNAIEILLAKLQLNIKRLQSGDATVLRQLIILLEVRAWLILIT